TCSGVDGMYRAIQQHGKSGCHIICFDMKPSTRPLMQSGLIDFSLLQEPEVQGYLPIKLLVDLLFYEHKITEKHIFTKIDICTKENLD
ncbi:MAG: hypothetical protein PHC86_07280, partial [Eubacteriales bacterium]|nr:hypothetical protein [Eubacteriales bacterium]